MKTGWLRLSSSHPESDLSERSLTFKTTNSELVAKTTKSIPVSAVPLIWPLHAKVFSSSALTIAPRKCPNPTQRYHLRHPVLNLISFIDISYITPQAQLSLSLPVLILGTLSMPVLTPSLCDNDFAVHQTLLAASVRVLVNGINLVQHHAFRSSLRFVARALKMRGWFAAFGGRVGVDSVFDTGGFDATTNKDSEGRETADYYRDTSLNPTPQYEPGSADLSTASTFIQGDNSDYGEDHCDDSDNKDDAGAEFLDQGDSKVP